MHMHTAPEPPGQQSQDDLPGHEEELDDDPTEDSLAGPHSLNGQHETALEHTDLDKDMSARETSSIDILHRPLDIVQRPLDIVQCDLNIIQCDFNTVQCDLNTVQ